MLTPAQRTSLNDVKAAVMNASTLHDKRRAAHDFRVTVAVVADAIDCDECMVTLADPMTAELDEEDCNGLIDLLQANSTDHDY